MRMSDKGSAPLCVMLMATAALGWGCLSPGRGGQSAYRDCDSDGAYDAAGRSRRTARCRCSIPCRSRIISSWRCSMLGATLLSKTMSYHDLKREGCRLGADAVVLTSEQKQHEGTL